VQAREAERLGDQGLEMLFVAMVAKVGKLARPET
jgi:hypothetical protein